MAENPSMKLKENRKMRMRGGENLRMRLLLSTLTLKRIIILGIREDAMPPGLLDHEISFIQLIEKISHGSKVNIKKKDTKLVYRPGTLMGGELEHDCGTSRAIGYFLAPIIVLALFGEDTLTITLKGITNDSKDASVETYINTTLPLLKKFGVPQERVDLKIKARGVPPLGGGEVVLSVSPFVNNPLKAITLIDEGSLASVRGFTFSSGVSGQFEDKMQQATHKVFDPMLQDVDIYTDNKQGEQAGKSPSYGITLVATTSTGCCYSADTTITGKDLSSTDNDVGGEIVRALLYEIEQAGVVDSTHQGLLFLLCALCPRNECQVRVGKLSPQDEEVLREIENFLGVMFDTRADADSSKERVILKCSGSGLRNLYRRVLPKELQREIMLRMDVKTVLTCKGLSKANRAMILETSFVEEFSAQSKDRLLGMLSTYRNVPSTITGETTYFLYIDENLEEYEMASQLQIPGHPFGWELVGILDGIMCLRCSNHVVLLNPGTRQFKEMPRIANDSNYYGTCIGFGLSRTRHHKVVLFGRYSRKDDEYVAYVCSTTNNDWKVVSKNKLAPYKFLPYQYQIVKWGTEYKKSVGVYLNRVCYWILSSGVDVDPLAIGAFDMHSDEFNVDKIAGTSCLIRNGVSPHTLSLCGDSLALLIHDYKTNEIEIWMMDEQQGWSHQMNIGPFPDIDHVLFFWKPGKLLMQMKNEEETELYVIESFSQTHELDVASGAMKVLRNPYTFTNRLRFKSLARAQRSASLNDKPAANDVSIAGISFYTYKETIVPIYNCDQVTWDASSSHFKKFFFGNDESDEDMSER